ncbi:MULTISPECIES: DUF4123 domain-containing protein [Sphingomonas]|uniref:DUF4123 domain-containing protein n=1 Tax=Sphingomonas TaxID=13687 RepID=UPI001471D9EA|nr:MULTISPECIES: DUF4123 domain-containing protein [Sphingomonas]
MRSWGLIDLAAAAPLVPLVAQLARSGVAHCLFEGPLDPALRQVSPHIVDMAAAPELRVHWRDEGRGGAWGVMFDSALPAHLARRHVRRLLQVRLPDGSGPVLLRLWDPRVLHPMLEQADGVWRDALFRDVAAYWIEEGAQMVRWPAAQPAHGRHRTRGILTVTPAQQAALARRQQQALAARLEAETGGQTRADRFAGYIAEAIQAGVTMERDAAALSLLLAAADRRGRPAAVEGLLADRAVPGALKVFQVRHALEEAGR